MGIIASTIVYFALNYLSRMRPFRNVDDTLGVIYTHGFAGLAGGLLVGIFADPNMALFYKTGPHGRLSTGGGVAGVIHGNWTLLKWQFSAAAFVIAWTAICTYGLLKLVGVFVPLRMSEENMEIGDVAEHGHEVYPSDVPSLGFPSGVPGLAPGQHTPTPTAARAHKGAGCWHRRRFARRRCHALPGECERRTLPGECEIALPRGMNLST